MAYKYLRVVSDIHIEFGNLFFLPELPEDKETILVIAGDAEVRDRFIRTKFAKKISEQFGLVVYILGNHEHYKCSLERTIYKIRAAIEKEGLKNFVVLDNEAFDVPGGAYRIYGGTMWTTFKQNDPLCTFDAQQRMNDFKRIRNKMYSFRLRPSHLISECLKFKTSLEEELNRDDGKKLIVVSHHAPSVLSVISEEHKKSNLLYAYVEDMSKYMLYYSKIKLWLHGHIHDSSDYTIGDTRVIANPYGYQGVEINSFFDAYKRVELS